MPMLVRSSLFKVLLHAYGRTGWRRRELLQALKGPNAPKEDVDPKRELASKCQGKITEKPLPELSARLRALLDSQRKIVPLDMTRSNPRAIEPNLPERNAWGRPLPRRRQRNALKRWYADMLDRALPPLPLEEMETLQNFASGKRKWTGPVSRRPQGASLIEDANSKINEGLPANSALRELLRNPAQAMRGTKRSKRSVGGLQGAPKSTNSRTLRRIYERILSQCPKMTWNPATMRWDVSWSQRYNKHGWDHPAEQHVDLFVGVDRNGNRARTEPRPLAVGA